MTLPPLGSAWTAPALDLIDVGNGPGMASFQDKLTSYLRSPKGQQMVQKAKEAANKPENRAKVQKLAERFTKRPPP